MNGDGLIVVDKPGGMTSHDVVARIRRLARTRRVGHGGTLDPMATGVLVIGVGRATRLLTYVIGAGKSYTATIRLGQATVTDDAEGDVLASTPAGELTDAAVRAAFVPLTGEIDQVPSAVSAIKINGERAYKRVRDGESVELPARRVTVSRLDVLAIRRDTPDVVDVDVDVDCSSGTYIRALARDAGRSLGVGGHLTALRRTAVGSFTLAESATLATLEQRAPEVVNLPLDDRRRPVLLPSGGHRRRGEGALPRRAARPGGHRRAVRRLRTGRWADRYRQRAGRPGPRGDRARPGLTGPPAQTGGRPVRGRARTTAGTGSGGHGWEPVSGGAGEERHAAVAGVRGGARWLGRSVVTIGVFDGVHQGHQATIGHAVARARELGVQSVVVTFDPHPAEVVRPGSHPAVLTEPARKAELIEALGVDVLCVVPFTAEFSRLPAEAFVHDILVEHLHAALVVVGDNFRFGHRAAGDVALLERLGGRSASGWRAPRWSSPTATVFSSTYIRSCVDAGDVAAAAAALGRPHRLEGVVVRGDQRGRELGFPTANLLCPPHAAVPADGVYAGWLVRAAAGTEPGCRRRSRSAPTRRSPAGSVGSRRTCWTSPATCTANGSPWTSSPTCGSSSGTTPSSR